MIYVKRELMYTINPCKYYSSILPKSNLKVLFIASVNLYIPIKMNKVNSN